MSAREAEPSWFGPALAALLEAGSRITIPSTLAPTDLAWIARLLAELAALLALRTRLRATTVLAQAIVNLAAERTQPRAVVRGVAELLTRAARELWPS